MRFPYARYEVDPSPTVPQGILYRPEIELAVSGPLRTVTIQALVDTGPDETVFPASLANALGVELDDIAPGQAAAVGGHQVRLVPGSVTLVRSLGDESYRWQSTFAFLETDKPEDEMALLGYSGFLEFFAARFDSDQFKVTLTPNNRFRRIRENVDPANS